MKLNIFTSTVKDGILSKDKNYFPKLTKEEINAIYEVNINRFLSKYNSDYKKAIILNDKNSKMSSRVVTENNSKSKDKILILKETTKNIPVLVETDDAPVIVASATTDNEEQVAVIGKASIDNLNNNLIHEMTEILMKETDKATFEMTFYIGPCPSKENYIIKDKSILKHKLFDKAIEEKDNKIYLDLRYAIFHELYLEIVDPNSIYFDSTDTVTSPKYFSTLGKKLGKHVTCVVFTDEEV